MANPSGSKIPSVSVGDRFTTRHGCTAEVIKYVSAKEVTVKFLDAYGYELTTAAHDLKLSSFRNPYYRSVNGVGYIGVGIHGARLNGKAFHAYQRWASMMARCYLLAPGRYEAYRGCTVTPEWHNFQNFAEWYLSQYRENGWQIDKDILCKGNRLYSPDNCSLVPKEINKAMVGGRVREDATIPLGVVRHRGRFVATTTKRGKQVYIGVFSTPEEAFYAYKVVKEAYIRELAEEYKAVITPEIYEAMMNWEVLITD